MLLPQDKAALRGSRLLPHASNAIAAVASCRGAVIARATYATYSNIVGGRVQVMASYIPGGTFSVGDQIRMTAVGSAVNNSGLTQTVGATIKITQGTMTQFYGSAAISASLGVNPYPWKSDILLATSLPGADGQYLSALSKAVVPAQISSRINNSGALSFTGGGTTLIGTNAGTSTFARGPLAAGSLLTSTFAQVVFQVDQPMLIEVYLEDVSGTTWSVTMQAGMIECM